MLRNRLLDNIHQCQRLKSLSLSTAAEIPKEFIKTVKFRTCINVYDELRLRLPQFYRKSPTEGVDLTIDYVDTQSNQKPKKTIVALHGLADSYRTFTPLIRHFQNRPDVRIVVPNFPDFSHTRATNYSFWHSSDEKYQLLQDLFRILNINIIDCLVSHSFGSQPTSALLQKPQDLQIRSLAMIAPQFLLYNLSDNTYKISKLMLLMSRSELLSRLLHRMKIHQSKHVPFKFTNIDEYFHLSTLVLDRQAFKDSRARVQSINAMKLPGFIMYSSDEKIISKLAQQELYKLLNINDDQAIHIDRDDPEIFASNFSFNNSMKKIIIKDGRHLPHQKCPNIVNFLIEKLINEC
ncbi:uncharacterized protein LOC124490971 [Dermatophagoides farinae]|uniref:Hydrolase/acyltransferase-like protein n=1 Tax=Dermatophagoides farinae TaxID=6954 RepID=A0A922IA80_DERFA|nr:uncharacterized protein LOC124490971 [Dermatophagoides farinae]KAH7639244.1 hydrolase/acyltransferase-like protein [Dermatophagoides farinae]KAH9522198.1 hypothetical protein DERF_005796 [Dermatophagoides farinae]